MIEGLLVITGLGLVSAGALVFARNRLAPQTDSLVDAINRTLPQTQCAQCGYPGCRPYAEAVAAGEAINRCPPGGDATIAALAELLGREPLSLDPACGDEPPAQVAVIREDECIGCTLCIAACPVDAISGAAQHMHTVIESECTGCDLCREPCPVDCIDLVERLESRLPIQPVAADPVAAEAACINCGLCAPACPRELQPQLLYWYRNDIAKAESHRLDACILCRRCDTVCPSNIPLTATFRRSRQALGEERSRQAQAARTEQRYLRREARRRQQQQRVAQRPDADTASRLLDALKEES